MQCHGDYQSSTLRFAKNPAGFDFDILSLLYNIGIMEFQNPDSELSERLRSVEERVSHLEDLLNEAPSPAEPDPVSNRMADGDSWVSFSGAVQRGTQELSYEWTRPVSLLLSQQWEESLTRVARLAHPIRAAILRKLMDSSCTVSDLVSTHEVTSTGAAYHHLNELISGGWVVKDTRGVYSIPAARVVPLLTLIAAGEDH